MGVAIPDGTVIYISCETRGEMVTSDVVATDLWERLPDGTYLPNAFVETGANGPTPGVPACSDIDAPIPTTESPWPFEAAVQSSGPDVWQQLLHHYFNATGSTVAIDFAFYASDARLLAWARQLPVDAQGRQYIATAEDGEVYWASGAFSVARTSEHCWSIKDDYDFAPNKLTNLPFIGNYAAELTGAAKSFTVRSSGCLP